MITPDLIHFVSQARQSGKSDSEITFALQKNGWATDDIAQALTPQPATFSAVPTPSLNFQGIGIRLLAQAIDFIVWFIIFGYLIALIFGQTTQGGFMLSGFPALLDILLAFAYFIILESLAGATVGKMVIKLMVVNEDGSKASMKAIIIRNLMRIVDFLPFGYIVGMISMGKSSCKQRVGDKIAHTVVVKRID